jgi:hypothetical protein
MKTSRVDGGSGVVELARQGRPTEIQEQFAPQLRPMVPAEAWITGIQLLPPSAAEPPAPWAPPPDADPDTFTDADITIGGGPLAPRPSVPAGLFGHVI